MKTWTTSRGVQVKRILFGRCNCHLIRGENECLLVDCGGKRSRKKLRRRLARIGAGEESPLTLVLTHTHFDHAENAASLKRECNVRIIVHEMETANLKRGENPPIQGTLPLTRVLTWILNRSPRLEKRFRYTGVAPDRTVSSETDLRTEGFPVTLMPTPGHSPGSMSVIIDNEIALVGDAAFGIFPGSAFPPFARDPRELIKSWQKLLDTGCSLFIPAHGLPRTRALLLRQYKKYSHKISM